MPDITEPLRLAVGSHEAGSGKGCAMNVISWENGDTTITDFPECADYQLTLLAQRVNDTICMHRTADLLCAECSVAVLELAHRTVGTADHGLSGVELLDVYAAMTRLDNARLASAFPRVPFIEFAHQLIDLFLDMTGVKPAPINPEVTACAVQKMKELAHAR